MNWLLNISRYTLLLGIMLALTQPLFAQHFDREGWRSIKSPLDYSETPDIQDETTRTNNKQAPATQQTPAGTGLSRIGQNAGIVLLTMAVVLLIILLLRRQGWLKKTAKGPANSGNTTAIEQYLPSANLDPLLTDALANAKYRYALRIKFLRVVQHFDQAGIIRWRPDGTNRQYAREVKDDALRTPFRTLMTWYEGVWYGDAPISLAQYEELQPLVQQLIPNVNQPIINHE